MANADGAVQKKKAKKKSLEEAEATEDAGDAKAQRKAAKRAAKEAALEATLEEEPAATKKKNKKNKEKVEVEVASPKKKAKRDALELAAEDEEDEAAVVTKKKKNKQEKQLEEDEDGEDEEGDEDLDPEEAKARKKARRKEAKRRRQMEKFSEEDLKKRADIKANNEAKNKQLKGKGKPTKKELYLAKKAELKAKKNAAAVSNSSETKPNVKVDPRQVECFLTGLPFLATEKHIAEHFACVGVCSVDILRHADTGKAKGTAFIRFQTAEEAARAVEYGQGSTIQSRWINVRLCEESRTFGKDIRLGTVTTVGKGRFVGVFRGLQALDDKLPHEQGDRRFPRHRFRGLRGHEGCGKGRQEERPVRRRQGVLHSLQRGEGCRYQGAC
eukprot:TRINITY_DN3203_c0_g1_i4.p1 TRINITY_DN3203_c0_g1~~TRINITY_DN3203_c0_g1_i4.p1  ORF type:complete len:385 (-),score=152.94 TRINITY_DN3203_c0_g1_i4:285-1439(-)